MSLRDEINALKREKEELEGKLDAAYYHGKAKFYSLKHGVVLAIGIGIGFLLGIFLA